MKFATVCMFLGIATCFATKTYSQETFFTLDVQNGQVKTVFDEIEKNSEFIIFYLDKSVNLKRKVSVSVENEPVEEILDQVFDGTNNNYSIDGRQITIYRNNARPVAAPQRVQEKEVKGVVADDFGEPIIGANVMVKGTTNGTITDFNGEFVLQAVPEDAVIVISYIGYFTQEMSVANQTLFNIKLTEDTQQLDAVVVIGYGTQKKGDVTSSVASVKEEGFLKGAVKDAGQLIQGQVAGLTITMPNGDPTQNTQISLRGNTTILGASTNPLVLIDGVPGDFNTVAPEDIESIDVLKDGSAAAIYGSRGTNGVILITTKKAKGNNINVVEYSGYISTSTISKRLQMMNAEEYIDYAGSSWDLGANTDWFKEVTRTPFSHVHNLSLKGGSSETNYVANLNFRQSQGIFKKSDLDRFQGRIEVNHNMFDNKLRLNFGIIGNQRSYTSTADGGSFNTYIYRQTLIHNPTQPVRDANGNWYEQTGLFEYANPVALLNETDGKQEFTQTRFTGNITFTPINDLILKAMFSYDKEHQYGGYYETQNHFSTVANNLNGYAGIGSVKDLTKLMELTAQYSKEIQGHSFTVLGGYSWQGTNYSNHYERNYDFPTDNYSYFNIGAGNAAKDGLGTLYSYALKTNLISFFGRLSYNYRNKYLLMLALRHEAASQLYGTNSPWGTFPSVSVGWRITQEEFMQGQQLFNDLKLRVGYGVTGTQPDASFLGVSLLDYTGGDNSPYFLYNGKWIQALQPYQNPNSYLKWEEKHEFNVGLDFSMFNGRFGGSIDYYYREIRDLLYNYTVPSPPNLYNTTTANVGVMSNKGLEILLTGAPVKTKDFDWNTTVTFSTNSNKLKSLSNDLYQASADYFMTGWIQEPVKIESHIVQVGQPIGNFYGYKVLDIADDGKWIYEDREGNAVHYDDFSHAFEDKQVLGNGLPKYYLGWNNNFRYKSFDLSVVMRGAFGFELINTPRMFYENRSRQDWNRLKSANDLVFGKVLLNSDLGEEFNSYYVEKGNYWKVDNITLGYTWRKPENKYIKSVRVYGSVLNALTITGYSGVDPEVSISGLNPGYDNRDTYPNTRSFTFGVNLTF